jgi:hypothetical protein
MPAWGECGGEDASVELRFKCDSSPPGTIRGEQPREVELGRSHARGARCAVWLRADCPPPSRPANTKIGRVLASVAADAMVLLMSAGASHLGPWLRPPMQLPGRLLPPPGLRRSGWGALTPLGLAMGRRLKTFLMPCLLLSMTRMIYDLLLSSDSPRRRCLRIRSPCLAGLSQECSTGRTLLPFTVTRNTSDRTEKRLWTKITNAHTQAKGPAGHKNPFFLSENSTRLTHRCSSHTSFFLPTALHAWAWGLGLERRMVGGGSRRGSAIIAIASSPPPRTDGAQQRRAEPRTALAPLPQPARTTRADPRVTPRCRRRRTSAARGSRATATAAAISLEISRHTRTQHRSRSPSRPRLLRGDCRRIPPPR